ncbi:MAG: hypothetical protein J6Y55_09480 [Bacteroidales bacterium]|nr:hypothetical protein [Bacteroidales bacterium]
MDKLQEKKTLVQKLVEQGYMWSYDVLTNGASDVLIIEKSLLHLEFEDMHYVFDLYGFNKVKKVWKERLLPQGEYLSVINFLLAALFFHIKNPTKYIEKYGRLA